MKKRGIALTLICAMVTVFAVGCGSTAAKTETPATAKKDSVIMVMTADIATLDTHKSASMEDYRVLTNIYEPLVKLSGTGEMVPALAESWQMSEDGKIYTFKLREGVKFHNGEIMKASDVVFSFDRAKNSPYFTDQVASVDQVEALSDNEVKITLSNAYAPFLLSLNVIHILSEKAVTELGDQFGENPVGTGPYKFVKHDIGERVVLERFEEYYDGPASIKTVEFKIIPDLNTALVALETGEVDFLYEIPMISKQSVVDNKALALHEYESLRLSYVLMNNSVKPFDNKLVRQAMNYAIDKTTIVQVAEEGMGALTPGIFSKDIFGYSDKVTGYEFNPEKAKALLAEAGYPNGFEITFKTMDGTTKKAAEIIQENLRLVGITVNIEVGEKNTYIQDLVSGNYEMGNISVSLGKDADFYGIIFKTDEQANFSKYSNKTVDELFTKARVLPDQNERLKVYEEIATLISDDGAIVPLYYPISAFAGKAELTVGNIEKEGAVKVYEMNWK